MMAKKQKISKVEQDKADMGKMQKRVKGLLPPKSDIPAHISIQQAQELKERVSELERKLTQQSGTDEKKSSPIMQETARQSLPAIKSKSSTSKSIVNKRIFRSPEGRVPRQFRNFSLSNKLIGVIAFVFIVTVAVQFQIFNARSRQQIEAEAQERLYGYYQAYTGRIAAESNAAGALASSIANRTDVQELYLKGDRDELYALLLPMFEDLKARQIVHLYIENPDGTVFLRVHNPKTFGDDVTYRGTAADALMLKETTSGIEMGPNRMGVRGVSPMYAGGRFIGMIEVGLDFDEQFIAELKELTGADFAMWVTYESAAIPGLAPVEGASGAPIEELFHYAGTNSQTLPVDPELYRSTLATGVPSFQTVIENTSTPSIVYVAPLLGYKDKLFGLLEISLPYTQTLNTLQASRIASLSVAGGLGLVGLLLILTTISQFVLKPIESLNQFAKLQMSGDTSTRVHVTSGDEFERLANTFNTLANSVEEERSTLEQRVADRTHDLELASEVGRTITEKVDDVSSMLMEAVEMIRSRFTLYYTQVYLLDPSGRTITLRAGTGVIGQQLLQRGHRLLVGSSSLNGLAASEKKPVIVSNTEKSATFLPNPLLPNTRSEMSIPLLVGNKVLGVLDMQSEIPDALNEENIVAFQILAGQLAVAIQNATLFTQSEEARKQVEENIRQTKEIGWHDFMNGVERNEKVGYTFNQGEVTMLKNTNETPTANGLSVPITVAGTSIGRIRVVEEEREWTSNEADIVQATAEQLAKHIDGLRLLSQAEKYRQEAEQVTRRLTREGWGSYLETRPQLADGYIYDLNEVHPLTTDNGAGKATINKPILIRDEEIGELAFDLDENKPGKEAQELIDAVTKQLGEHIENLRLSEQNEKRASQLETVATVSTTASTVLDPDELLKQVVNLTKERFNLYHAHIYLLDESWDTLLLAAGAGEVGQQMATAGHAIPLNTEHSLVARAAREKQAVIVNDVHGEVDFLSNPLLPETRAEMAIPMIVGDTVLGVLDVQSQHAEYFSQEDISIQTTLAAQIAIALQNARLYVEQAATVTQLRELDKLKSSFLANMSHELRTPLNSILGFTDVMLEELDGPLTPNMDNDLKLIQKNGQHLLHLINDVLDMAKIESGKLNLTIERFNLHEIMEEVASITSLLASEKDLALLIDPDSDHEVEVNADRTRLRQVIINLVNNALKFTEKGKITIHIAREESNVLISVKDTGIGIHPSELETVFQEFSQVDSSSTRKTGGTGLGLPISRRLIEMHGGRLWAESTGIEGEGATFYVFLPIEAKVAESEPITKS